MAPRFSEIENEFINLVNLSEFFIYKGKRFDINGAYKPRPSQGECKTDVFIQTKQGRDFKISIKKSNADFVENKMSYERAKQIFGNDVNSILENSIKSIESSFESHPLICFEKHKRTEEKTIMLGWKFELLNRISGEKSGELLLSDVQKINIYAGTELDLHKKNAFVNGEVVANSGVAEYVLVIDTADEPLQVYIDRLELVEDFAVKQRMYFACKALNYRSLKDKWDGDRPLAVHVKWELENDILTGSLVYDTPLQVKGNFVAHSVRDILNKLNINSNNFNDLRNFYRGNSFPN